MEPTETLYVMPRSEFIPDNGWQKTWNSSFWIMDGLLARCSAGSCLQSPGLSLRPSRFYLAADVGNNTYNLFAQFY